MHDLPISVNDRVISPIREGLIFHETSHMRSFAKIKLSRKFQNLQYPMDRRGHIQNVLAQSECEHGLAVPINETARNGIGCPARVTI